MQRVKRVLTRMIDAMELLANPLDHANLSHPTFPPHLLHASPSPLFHTRP